MQNQRWQATLHRYENLMTNTPHFKYLQYMMIEPEKKIRPYLITFLFASAQNANSPILAGSIH